MIEAVCRTNLDDFRGEVWPRRFVDVPKEGDMVQGNSGRRLKVCRITHRVGQNEVPYIEIELINELFKAKPYG